MTIFIEDYYKKHAKSLKFKRSYSAEKWLTFDEVASQSDYHPYSISYAISKGKLISNIRNLSEEEVQNDLRFRYNYKDILELDYQLDGMCTDTPPFFVFFEKYNNLKDFLYAFAFTFFSLPIYAHYSLTTLTFSIINLKDACIKAVTQGSDHAADHVIFAKYYFCLSLMSALHGILSVLYRPISFITCTAASIHALCTDNEDLPHEDMTLGM